MANKYRIGTTVKADVYITNIPEEILGSDMGIEKYMYVQCPYGTFKMQNISLLNDGNGVPVGVSGKFAGADQRFIGKYDIIIIMSTKRLCIDEAFELVRHIDEADTEETTEVTLDSSVSFLSSSSSVSGYEEWRQTNDGTIQDYWDWLRKDSEEIWDAVSTETAERKEADNQLMALIKAISGDSGETIDSLLVLLGEKLSKASDDTAAGIITFLQGIISQGTINAMGGVDFGQFIDGLFGQGGRITADGVGILRSLRLFEWLEVPEIRFNRITVNIGLSINSVGGGILENVVIDLDEDGNQLATGSAYLKLEDGEYGAVAVNDLCMGLWHDFGGGNATENSDDKKGNVKIRGFKTIYFWITEIPATDSEGRDNSDNHFFHYQVRSSLNGGNGIHPVAMLHFAQRGNTSDTERQTIDFSTTKYTLNLYNLSSWDFSASNIYGIQKELEGFSMESVGFDGQTYIKKFHGTGHVLGNVYIYGEIDKFERLGYRLVVEQSLNGSIAPGEVETETCSILNGYGEDVTYKFVRYSITRDSGDAASDAVWNAQHTDIAIEQIPFSFEIAFSDLGIRSATQISSMFMVTASDETKKVTAEQSLVFN